jgi:hypothetical protein
MCAMRPASVDYARQADLPVWIYNFQHQLSDGGKYAPKVQLSLVAALREFSATLAGAQLGHGVPRGPHRESLCADLGLALDGAGPRVQQHVGDEVRRVAHLVLTSAAWRKDPGEAFALRGRIDTLVARCAEPASRLAAFDDAAESYERALELQVCEQRMRTLRQIIELAGFSYRGLTGRIAAALNDDAFSLIELGAPIDTPEALNQRAAGMSVDERWEICRRGVTQPPYQRSVIAWLIFENAYIFRPIRLGPVEFFSGRGYPETLRQGWGRPEGPPPEVIDTDFWMLPDALPDRECVLVRVQLEPGPVAGAAERAIGLVKQVMHMADDSSEWVLMEGVALFGRDWFGSQPRSTLDQSAIPTNDVIHNPTADGLRNLAPELVQALATADERAVDVASDRTWLASLDALDDAAQRVALTVRLLERRLLHLKPGNSWSKSAAHFLRGWWADERVLNILKESAESGIGALPDRWQPNPELTLHFRSLMLPDAGGLRFHIEPSNIIRHASELVEHLAEGSVARQIVEETLSHTSTPEAALVWLRELASEFDVLVARAARQRNAVLHGNDTIPEVIDSIDAFAMRLASMVVDQQTWALEADVPLREQMQLLLDAVNQRDAQLVAREHPADVLLQ